MGVNGLKPRDLQNTKRLPEGKKKLCLQSNSGHVKKVFKPDSIFLIIDIHIYLIQCYIQLFLKILHVFVTRLSNNKHNNRTGQMN
jgi:hypothetical protein